MLKLLDWRGSAQLALLALLGLACSIGCSKDAPAPAAGQAPTKAPAPDGPPPSAPKVKSLLLITVDTLRADALSCYTAPKGSTPYLDQLASESLLFERAYTQATHTHAALSSMHTGLTPPVHGVLSQAGKLRPNADTIAEQLQAADFETGSFVANLCRLQELSGNVMHDGWDTRFCGMDFTQEQWIWDRRVVDGAIAWLKSRGDERFFCWVHLMDPHGEHRPPPETWDYEQRPVMSEKEQLSLAGQLQERFERPDPELLQEILELYAAEVRGVDAQIGRLLEAFDGLSIAADTAVIFSADHGEELYETWAHSGHGMSLTEGVLHVPLLVRAPGLAPGRRSECVETLQVAPTVLELVELAPRRELDGPSLFAAKQPDEALSFCNRTISVRHADTRLWRIDERLPDDPEFKLYLEAAPYLTQAPWFVEPQLLATYAAAAPTMPLWQDLEDAAFELRLKGLRLRTEAYLSRGGKGISSEKVDDEEFQQMLKDLGYL